MSKYKTVLLMMWSKDWSTLTPWTISGKRVGYFAHVTKGEDIFFRRIILIGPLCIQTMLLEHNLLDSTEGDGL